MSVGIIRYPGSNCDLDTLSYFENSFFIWHKETKFPDDIKLLVIPGGFAFGDRVYNKATDTYTIDPGKMAIDSLVTAIIGEAVIKKIPILGICNGFQILIQLGLLPGELLLNKNGKFTCKHIKCIANYISNKDNQKLNSFSTYLYVANSYGCYSISDDIYQQMQQNNQIFLKYDETLDEVNSFQNIAGICNKERTIFGMMPHPERNNTSFKPILDNILFPLDSKICTQMYFHTKILELMHSEHISYKSTRNYSKTITYTGVMGSSRSWRECWNY